MKKMIIAMVALLGTFFTTANAMGYEQAREQALFLTDKMAYELNLDEEQYEAAYEINLDYLLSVNTYDDVFADYWVHRNADLRYILLDWQYDAFCAASYFYRPLWWDAGHWHFGIYARYPHRDYFYFGRPHFYVSYRGGHGWHHNGGRSWYHTNFSHSHRGTHHRTFSGMRDGWNRGDYRGGRMERGTRGSYVAGPQRGGVTTRRGSDFDGRRGGGMDTRRDGYNNSTRSNSGRMGSTRTTVGRNGFSSSSERSSGGRVSTNRGYTESRTGNRGFSGSRESSTRSFTPSHGTSSAGSRGGGSGSVTRGGGSSNGGGSGHGGGFGGRR